MTFHANLMRLFSSNVPPFDVLCGWALILSLTGCSCLVLSHRKSCYGSEWPKSAKRGSVTKGKSQLFTEAYRYPSSLTLHQNGITSVCPDRPQDSRHFDVTKSSTFSAKTEQAPATFIFLYIFDMADAQL